MLKPYRILTLLMDRPEIGPVIVDDVFLDVLDALRRHAVVTTTKGRRKVLLDDVTKAANLLFGTFESTFMWNFVSDSLEKTAKREGGEKSIEEIIELGKFLLDTVMMVSFPNWPWIERELFFSSLRRNFLIRRRLFTCPNFSLASPPSFSPIRIAWIRRRRPRAFAFAPTFSPNANRRSGPCSRPTRSFVISIVSVSSFEVPHC